MEGIMNQTSNIMFFSLSLSDIAQHNKYQWNKQNT